MSHQRFLPGFETAPGAHRALVTRPDSDAAIHYADTHPSGMARAEAHDSLARKQRVARALGPVTLDPATMETAPARTSWNDLRDRTNRWLDAHLTSVNFGDFNPERFPTAEAAYAKIYKAAIGGTATIAAFQEVVPRVLAWRLDSPLQDPNVSCAEWVARSKGLIVEWLGLDAMTDYRLADALAINPTGDEITVFDDLHFEWIYFIADTALREVHLDSELIPALRFGDLPVRNIMLGDEPGGEPLFGCPARKMIPRIFDVMHGQAVDFGLYGQTYLEERARYDQMQCSLSSLAR